MSLSSGTRGYRAPEILFAVNEFEETSVYDESCDNFSLGCLVYKIVTGRLPHSDDNMYCTHGVPFPGNADAPRDVPAELFQEPEKWRSGWNKRLARNRVGQWTRSAEMRKLAVLTAGLLRVESYERIDLYEVLKGIAPYGEKFAKLNEMYSAMNADLEHVARERQRNVITTLEPLSEDAVELDDDFEAWCAAERRRAAE